MYSSVKTYYGLILKIKHMLKFILHKGKIKKWCTFFPLRLTESVLYMFMCVDPLLFLSFAVKIAMK